jgi:hypothetical protein
MHYGLQMLERTAWEEKFRELETKFSDMHSDFEKCARGTSPCFFCANDEHCVNPDEHGCHFIWKRHE